MTFLLRTGCYMYHTGMLYLFSSIGSHVDAMQMTPAGTCCADFDKAHECHFVGNG
ncbi:MAG: hypothetical protein LKF96_07175 [Treponema sp.]|nr:hypothetical protein [Treponema sp.]